MKKNHIALVFVLALISVSCATQQKLKDIRETHRDAQLTLSDDVSNLPELKIKQITRDTLKIKDEDGSEILIMKAVKDEETGEMVAADILEAAQILPPPCFRVNSTVPSLLVWHSNFTKEVTEDQRG